MFLGLTGYYRKFIENYSSIASPLTDPTKKSAPRKVVWTTECEQAFQELKKCLCGSPVLRSPDFTKTFIVQTDASDRGVMLQTEGLELSSANKMKRDKTIRLPTSAENPCHERKNIRQLKKHVYPSS